MKAAQDASKLAECTLGLVEVTASMMDFLISMILEGG